MARVLELATLDSLEQLDPDLIASDRVTLIAIDAVRDRLGDRWPSRREQVWTHIDRVVGRALKPGDLFKRVSDVEYVLAFASEPPAVARGRSLRLLSAILTHFVGSTEAPALKVSSVFRVCGGEIWCERLPNADVQAFLDDPDEAPGAAEPAKPAKEALAEAGQTWVTTSLRLSSGRQLRLCLWRENLQHVRMPASVGLRFARDIMDDRGRTLSGVERENLSPLEAAELDLSTLHDVCEGLEHWGDQAGLFLAPVNFNALSSVSARLRLISRLSRLKKSDRDRLILEIEGVGADVPSSRLYETLGLVGPHVRGLVVQSPPSRVALERLRQARPLGVALEGAGLEGGVGEVFGRLKLLRERSRGIVPEVFALGLGDPALRAIVTAAEVGFYSLRPEFDAGSLVTEIREKAA